MIRIVACAKYLDNAAAWPSAEPVHDYAAVGILLFARQIEPGTL